MTPTRAKIFVRGGGPDPKEGPTQAEGPPAPLKGPCGHIARISLREGYVSFEATGGGGGVQSENFQTLFFPCNAIDIMLKFLSNVILSMQRHKRNIKLRHNLILSSVNWIGQGWWLLLLQTRQAQMKWKASKL